MCRLLIHAICGLKLEKSWLGGEILLRCEQFEEVDQVLDGVLLPRFDLSLREIGKIIDIFVLYLSSITGLLWLFFLFIQFSEENN